MGKRKILDVELDGYISFYDILDNKTPEKVIEAMAYYQKEYVNRDIYFSVVSYYDDGVTLSLRERREENDKEFAKRQAAENKKRELKKKAKAVKEAEEFLTYQRLSKKFNKSEETHG